MAEGGGPDLSTSDNTRKVVVSGLPEDTDEDSIVDYFESRRRFGDILEVESVDNSENHDNVVITFKNEADAQKVLSKHAKSPLTFNKRGITVRAKADNVDDSESYHSSYGGGSWLSISMIGLDSLSDIGSSELFGSGNRDRPNFSDQFCTVELHNNQQQSEPIKKQLTQEASEVVSYAATTKLNSKDTLLELKLKERLKTNIQIEVRHKTIVIKAANNDDNTFENTWEDVLQSLQDMVIVTSLNIDANTADVALKHFDSVVRKNDGIKIYRTDDDTVDIACLTGYQSIVNDHISIVKEQSVTKSERDLSEDDYFKLKACRQKIENLSALVSLSGRKLVVEGYAEDILTARACFNQIILQVHHVCEKLETFEDGMLKHETIRHKLQKALKHLQVWWEISDHSIHIVGQEKHVNDASECVKQFFLTKNVHVPKYILESDAWETLTKTQLNNFKNEVFFEEDTEQETVSVKGTTERVFSVCLCIEDLKHACFREENILKIDPTKIDFVQKRLAKEIENPNAKTYLKVEVDTKSNFMTVQGVKSALEESVEHINNISTLKYWLTSDDLVNLAKRIASTGDWEGILVISQNHCRIILKTGRIEKQQADVLVNSAGNDLVLDTGNNTVCKSIVQEAGLEAQISLQNVDKPVKVGSVVEGKPGKLQCKKVLHVVMEKYTEAKKIEHIKVLRQAIHACLLKASQDGYNSIAFPALCTGVHCFPVNLVAETVLDTLTNFMLETKDSSLREIYIVLLENDKQKMKVFKETQRTRQHSLTQTQEPLTRVWACSHRCYITGKSERHAKDYLDKFVKEIKHQTSLKQ